MAESIQALSSSLRRDYSELGKSDLHHLIVSHFPHQDVASNGGHKLLTVEVPQLPGLVESITVNFPDKESQFVLSTLL